MSAYVVNKQHIDMLIALALHGPRSEDMATSQVRQSWGRFAWEEQGEFRELNDSTADVVGATLWGENVRSVEHRYPDTKEGGEYRAELDGGLYAGEEMTAAFNPHYLLRALATTGGDLWVRDGLKPGVSTVDGRTALVMPVRLPAPIG